MHIALVALTVWVSLSVLFAAAHCRLCRYAPVAQPPMKFGPKTWRSGPSRLETEPMGADVAEFFHSYARA